MNLKKVLVNSFLYFPNWLNEFLLSLNKKPHLIYGKDYMLYKSFLEKNKLFLKKDTVVSLINYAVKYVPFYEKYKKIQLVDEIEKMDFINKDIVAENFNKLQSLNIKKTNYDLVTTGGTTGKPLRMLLPKSRYIIEYATLHWIWGRIGYNYHTRAVITNHKLKSQQIYKVNPLKKEYIFDGFRNSDYYYQEIYNIIKRKKIKFIHAYPSNAYSFAKFMLNHKLDYSFIKGIISSSENVLEHQKKLIEQTMGIDFLTFYGHSEKLVLAWYCKYCKCSHVENSYGYFELIDRNGQVIKEIGKVGEIVGTTLNNRGFPLIRYRTDDFAELVGYRCEHEKRDVLSIKNIRGRWTGSYIYDNKGLKTTPTALNFHDDLYLYIDGIQYVQEKKGNLIVLIIKGELFSKSIELRLKNHFQKKMPNINFKIKYVRNLIKQKNGKFLDLITKIND